MWLKPWHQPHFYLNICPQGKYFTFCTSKIFHTAKPYFTRSAGTDFTENTAGVFFASFRSRGALFCTAASESRRFSAEKRRLMFAPN
jgi:hypothetical protein